MEVTQSCDVCGEEGRFLSGQVRIVGLSWPHQGYVAQCPECRRFFCLTHSEGIPVELDESEIREHGDQIAKLGEVPRLLCCPLDLDTPLGDADEEGHLFVASLRSHQ